MLKKLCTMFIFVFIFACFSVTAFAAQSYDKNTQVTSNIRIVNITKPESSESTFKKSYVICGKTEYEDVTVKLFILNKDTNRYEPFENVDGKSRWDIGASGVFMKEIELPNKGANEIMIVCYRNSEKDKEQINKFTITLLEQKNILDIFKSSIDDFIDGVFKKK